jgi:hypothetical protein
MIERIIGVDPGLATGLCSVYPAVGYEASWTVPWMEACDWLQTAAAGYGPRLLIATELYVPRKGVYAFQPESLKCNGVIEWACHKYGCQYEPQLVSDAKAFVSNERLRNLGWWNRGGADHERDAARHVLLYLARSGRYNGSLVNWGAE